MQFHEQILVIDFPDPCIQFQEKIAVAKITQEQTAVTIANKIFIISKCYINIFGDIKSEIASCIKIINTTGSLNVL